MDERPDSGATTSNAPTMPDIGLTFDCADAAAQARFWTLALGNAPAPVPEGWATCEAFLRDHDVPQEEWDDGAAICDQGGRRPMISLLKVSGGRNADQTQRAHRIEAKVGELLAAEAAVQVREMHHGRLDHVVMRAPEGNEFCVV